MYDRSYDMIEVWKFLYFYKNFVQIEIGNNNKLTPFYTQYSKTIFNISGLCRSSHREVLFRIGFCMIFVG